MIIRSQDKMQLINSEEFVLTVTHDGAIIYTKSVTCSPDEAIGGEIARYRNKDTALKVLDMCQKAAVKCIFAPGGPMATANFYIPPFGYTPPKVFEMPLDKDVDALVQAEKEKQAGRSKSHKLSSQMF